jgi:hypothetical protein
LAQLETEIIPSNKKLNKEFIWAIQLTLLIKKFLKQTTIKEAKLTLYWTIIRPVITYSSKTWVVKESIKQKLLITERKILRRIFGPTKDRKIVINDELSNLIRNKNIKLTTLRHKD